MLDLIKVIQQTLSKSALADLDAWFAKYPKGAFWGSCPDKGKIGSLGVATV
jgi:hypothetical protein